MGLASDRLESLWRIVCFSAMSAIRGAWRTAQAGSTLEPMDLTTVRLILLIAPTVAAARVWRTLTLSGGD